MKSLIYQFSKKNHKKNTTYDPNTQEQNNKLLSAIANENNAINSVKEVKSALEKGADPNVWDHKNQRPAIMSAVRHSCNSEELVKAFLTSIPMLKEKGIKLDLDQPNDTNWTAVFAAIAEHHIEIVKLLIEAGASITVQNENGDTPASLARRHGLLKLPKKKSNHQAFLTFLYQEERNLGIILEEEKHQQSSSIKKIPEDIKKLILYFLFLEVRVRQQVIPTMENAKKLYAKKTNLLL